MTDTVKDALYQALEDIREELVKEMNDRTVFKTEKRWEIWNRMGDALKRYEEEKKG